MRWAARKGRTARCSRVSVLRGLVVGDAKGLIARRLGISNGRLSQLLDLLAGEIRSFFTPELLPTWCAA